MSNGCCEHFSVPSPSGQIYNALVLEVLLLVRGGTLYNLRAGVNKRAVNFYRRSRLYDKKNRLYFKYYFNVRTNSHTFTLIGTPPPFLISLAVSLLSLALFLNKYTRPYQTCRKTGLRLLVTYMKLVSNV